MDDDERADLVAEVGRVLSAPGGRALLVGEPGVGRSTVLARVARRAEESGARVLRVRPGRSSARTPFLSLADLLPELPDPGLGGLAAAPHRLALRLAVSRAVRSLQRSGPVVISVDDWTQLDPESADLIGYVTSRDDDPGPALVATQAADTLLSGRPWSIDRALFPPGSVHLVPSLSAPGLAAVLAGWQGHAVPPDVLLDLHRATGGNPAWAMELLDRPVRRLLPPHPGPRLPGSVAETVLTRVRPLPSPVQRVLAACAAAGGAPARTVSTLADADLDAVAAAVEEGLVVPEHERLVVAHPLLGAAALRLVGLGVQLEIHARAAAAATGLAERARHLDQAVLPGPDDGVASALGAAAEEAWAEGSQQRALVLAERALARTPDATPGRTGRAVRLAELAVASGSFDRAAAVLADLDLVSSTPALLDRALPVLVAAIGATAGEDAAQHALAALAARADDGTVRGAMIDVRRVSETESAADRAARAHRALRLLAGERDLPAAQHRALGLLLVAGLDAGQGLDPVVLARLRALEAELPTLPLLDTADAAVGLHGYEVDDLTASRAGLELLADQAERRGETSVAGTFRAHLVVVEVLGGRTAQAAALLERFDGGDPGALATAPVVVRARGSLALVRGDEAALEAALASSSGAGTAVAGRVARLVLRGAWATAHEHWAESVPVLSEALELAARHGCDEPGRRLSADTLLGPGLVALGRAEEAGRIADHLESLARAGGRPLLSGHALRLRGLVSAASGDLGLAQAQLQRAADLLGDGQVPGDRARCLLDLGRVLRRRRAREESRRVLRDVQAVARRTGDRPLLALVERELAAVRRAAAPDALTAAERRVATAAADGLRNSEIAAACFVSVRTVETQLSTVYRKLGVRSRVQLVTRLRSEAPARSA